MNWYDFHDILLSEDIKVQKIICSMLFFLYEKGGIRKHICICSLVQKETKER